jgi:hypothetical protein
VPGKWLLLCAIESERLSTFHPSCTTPLDECPRFKIHFEPVLLIYSSLSTYPLLMQSVLAIAMVILLVSFHMIEAVGNKNK